MCSSMIFGLYLLFQADCRLQHLSLKLEVTPFCSWPFVEVSTDVLLYRGDSLVLGM